MTPYDLEETKRRAREAVLKNPETMLPQIFHMLQALLQHEADKEAERCLARNTR